MPTYEQSDLLLNASNIEVIIDGESLTIDSLVGTVTDSSLLYKADNVELIIEGQHFVRTSIEDSDLIFRSDNVEYIIKGASLTPPINTELRQIYSDGTHVYAATTKGLAVFNP